MNKSDCLTAAQTDLDGASATRWDVLVIGAGVGGSATAHAMVQKGYRVLLVEKGHASFDGSDPASVTEEAEDPEERLRQGKWPHRIKTVIDGREAENWAPMGCGAGGSSLLYSAALNRLECVDFERREGPDGRWLEWPFDYSDLEPYYEQAERLMQVSGTPDPLTSQSPSPLRDPPPMSDLDRHFFEQFRRCGLNPYRQHIGVLNLPGCELCGGMICDRLCKQDAATGFLLPVSTSGRLNLLDRCVVDKLVVRGGQIDHVLVSRGDAHARISADQVFLAAGALFSPPLLIRSRNDAFPGGLGNNHDLVGRNLMFHVSEHAAIWPRGKFDDTGVRNTISVRDFYYFDGEKYGELQSLGFKVGYGNLLYYLRSRMDQSMLRRFRPLRYLLNIPAYIGSRLLSEASVFACILEDFPYLENRVVVDESHPSGMRVEYAIHDELKTRVKKFRRLLRRTISTNHLFPMTADLWLNLGHPCGTCRSGPDPVDSVVDTDCRVHGIDNLYVVDASFFPTSGGANPSLTIAANAMRVADRISGFRSAR